jgi:hypothetical protein
LWCKSSRKASQSTSPCKEHHDNDKTLGNATNGPVWSYHLHKHHQYQIPIANIKYGRVNVDDYSCFTWSFFLQDKSEMQEVLKKFLRWDQNEFDAKVKKIRSDNDIEFKNTQVEDFLDEEGIKHEFLVPYTPQQNGMVEMMNQTLIEMTRTMIDE